MRVRTPFLITAVIASSILICLSVTWWAIDGTNYAPGYSEWRFRSVKIGMDEKGVFRLLGAPLHVSPWQERIEWIYVGPTRIPNGPSMAPEITWLTADLSGVVKNVSGTYLKGNVEGLIGQPLDAARVQFGEPARIYKTTSRKFLCYATGPGYRSHFNRWIGVDVSGRVSEIIADWYQD